MMKAGQRFWIQIGSGYAVIVLTVLGLFYYLNLFEYFRIIPLLGVLTFLYGVAVLLAKRTLRSGKALVSRSVDRIFFVSIVLGIAVIAGMLVANGAPNIKRIHMCSMAHWPPEFDAWWERHHGKYPNITKKEFQTFPFSDGFVAGAPMVPVELGEIEIGDVIAYDSGIPGKVTTHRVIGISKTNGSYVFETLGDNNRVGEIVQEYQVGGRLVDLHLLRMLFLDGCRDIYAERFRNFGSSSVTA